MAISREHLSNIRARLTRFKEEQRETIESATAIVEINAASFGIGWLHGRKGIMPTLWGVPYDALLAGAAYVVALGKLAGRYSGHVLNLGHGFAAYYSGNLGAQLGQRMRKESPDWKGVALTEDEAKAAGGQARNIVAGNFARRQMGMGAGYGAPHQQQMAHAAGWY
jgi:hypothetical protein